jgi:excisionase family DNA binding protein
MNDMSPILITPKETCRLLGIGNTKLYSLIKAKRLSIVKIGRATRIPLESIYAFASSLEELP